MGGENKESSGNVKENAGKKKKDGKKKNGQQKEDKRVSEEGLSGGRMVEDNKSRRCCSRACGNEQCREGGNVSHRW